MLINAREEEEIRVAIVEDGILQELDIKTTAKEQLKGNIYKAKVVNVEQGLQAAFVDFSGGKPGFLSLGEIQPNYLPEKEKGDRRRIQEVLKRGQELLVQVTKDEIGAKGAALTTYISLPGRYLVLMPGSDSSGISRKIEDEVTRQRLKKIMGQLDVPSDMGLIVRTAGLDRTKTELGKDLTYLLKLWETIAQKGEEAKAAALIYQDLNVIIRAIRDYFTTDIGEVLIDNQEVYEEAKEFFADVMPRFGSRVKLYSDKRPLFSKFDLENQIEMIYEWKIPLKGGGSIIIEPTEALVTIDVNSGRGLPKKGMEETAYQTNLEAAREAARQLRLRDLGGLVVIDFIDMRDRKHKAAVEREFRAAVKPDKARIQTSSISRFGLMELSRQRLRSPLMDVSFSSCPNCQGHGVIKSTEAKSMEILRKIHTAAAQGNVREVRGIMSASVVEYLLNRKRRELLQIETDYDVKVVLSGTTEILGTHYELEYIRRDVPKEERPPRTRRRRRRAPKSEEPEAVSKPQAEALEESPHEEPVSEESQEGLLHAGLRFISRLRPTPLRWLRAEEEEPSRTDSPLPSPQDALEEVAEVIERGQASGGGEDAPVSTEQTSSGRRRSRSRSSRRRRSSRSRATSSKETSSPKGDA
ncbi:MAG: Rne/Rng family ribonuclease [bacterium]|nr:Rne/Rng family ribonuclease [bacterium]MDV2479203.1 Rne/Rng family ribonuclease [bacterium]